MRVLITGGAGFAGSNIAARFMERGVSVTLMDDFSRQGSTRNLEILRQKYDPKVIGENIADPEAVRRAFTFTPDVVIHCAAKTSLREDLNRPYEEFQTNVLGTLNLLEASKEQGCHFIFFSTNKVYGDLFDVPVVKLPTRYAFRYITGITETQPIKPHIDPYSCSKVTADYYCQIYSKFIDVAILRCSTLYGPMQWVMPGQGWVGRIVIESIENKVRIAGDGRQTRDILYITGLVDLVETLVDRRTKGIFNIGGGRGNALSMLELMDLLPAFGIIKPVPVFTAWHSWTQKVYIADTTKIKEETGWIPKVDKQELESYIKQWLLGEVLPQGSSQSVA